GIQNLNTSFDEVLKLTELTQGVDLVGKSIQYTDPSSGQSLSGEVESIVTAGRDIQVGVNGRTIALSDVTSVSTTGN
ncbi:MAG: hypothetical protein AAGA30_16390, partial [Planctomycetota bacterium]